MPRMQAVLLLAVLYSNLVARAQTGDLLWSRANPTGAVPSPRIDAPIAYDAIGRQLLMFGGQDASGDRNDLWSYSVDQQQWTQLSPGGVAPNPRHGHTVTFDPVRRRIIVIAGQGAGVFGDASPHDIRPTLWTHLSGISTLPSPQFS